MDKEIKYGTEGCIVNKADDRAINLHLCSAGDFNGHYSRFELGSFKINALGARLFCPDLIFHPLTFIADIVFYDEHSALRTLTLICPIRFLRCPLPSIS